MVIATVTEVRATEENYLWCPSIPAMNVCVCMCAHVCVWCVHACVCGMCVCACVCGMCVCKCVFVFLLSINNKSNGNNLIDLLNSNNTTADTKLFTQAFLILALKIKKTDCKG